MKKIVSLSLGACTVGALALALLVLVFDSESSATAKKNFCDSLHGLSSSVMNYEGLDPATATNDERTRAATDLTSAWDDVVDEAHDWAEADDNALTEAYNDLYYAIDTMPGDYTIAQSIESLESELMAFPKAFRVAFDGSGCSTS